MKEREKLCKQRLDLEIKVREQELAEREAVFRMQNSLADIEERELEMIKKEQRMQECANRIKEEKELLDVNSVADSKRTKRSVIPSEADGLGELLEAQSDSIRRTQDWVVKHSGEDTKSEGKVGKSRKEDTEDA